MENNVSIHWRQLEHRSDDGWDQLRWLYAYWSRRSDLLYIGKAWGKTVRERWHRNAKAEFWDDLERERRIFHHGVAVGTLALQVPQRLTHELLSDVESLLIQQNGPWGNIQCQRTRIIRPGLIVRCRDDWFESRKTFWDAA